MRDGYTYGLGDLPVIKITEDINKFPDVWRMDRDVVRARSHFSDRQRQTWALGMDAFEAGKWDVAKIHFENVLESSGGKDGPSRCLLGRIEKHCFSAPESWRGYWTGQTY